MLTTYHTLIRGPSKDLFASYCRRIVFSCLLIMLHPVAFGQTQHPAGNLDVDESYPGNLQTLTIALPATTVGGDTILSWDVNTSLGSPDNVSHGVLTGEGTQNLVYTPNLYSENQDSFIWEAMVSGGTVERFRVVIDVNSVKNEPQIGANTHNTKFINTPPEADLSEGQTTSNDLLIYVIDYDSNATLGELVPTIVEDSSNLGDDDWFTISSVDDQAVGNTYCFRISSTTPFNYESVWQTEFVFDLVFTDDSGIPATIDDFTINILDEPEDPQIKSATSFSRNLNEGDDTETKQDFIPVVISADDEDDGSSISWRYTLSNTHIGGTVKLDGTTLTKCLAEWFYSR